MKKNILFLVFLFLFTNMYKSQFGIGTDNPDPSAVLQVESSNKGVLFPRVTLVSDMDNTSITNPAHGLTVFNTSSSINGQGIYVNMGIDSAPQWQKMDTSSLLNSGIVKLIYNGVTTNASRILDTQYYEWRMIKSTSTTYAVQARLKSIPTSAISITGSTILWNGTTSASSAINATWSSTDWDTWKNIYTTNDNWDSMMFLRVSNDLTKFYKLGAHVQLDQYNLLTLEVF